MKVVHVCLAEIYKDNHNYQENELVRAHVDLGCEVYVIASTETYVKGVKKEVKPESYVTSEGAKITRLSRRFDALGYLSKKIRSYKGFLEKLLEIEPDVIIFHGVYSWELLTLVKYKKRFPSVTIYADNHADKYNSARGLAKFLHILYYKPILKFALPSIDRILSTSLDSTDFLTDLYEVPESKIVFMPLGGTILEPGDYEELRNRCRAKLRMDKEIVCITSGRFLPRKRLDLTLSAIEATSRKDIRLVIAGNLMEPVKSQLSQRIKASDKIEVFEWLRTEELTQLLCASDVYIQPGSRSVTLQHSICCGCAVLIKDIPSHQPFLEGNGWLTNSPIKMAKALDGLTRNQLDVMQRNSIALATKKLDYLNQARQLLPQNDHLTTR